MKLMPISSLKSLILPLALAIKFLKNPITLDTIYSSGLMQTLANIYLYCEDRLTDAKSFGIPNIA